MPEELSEEDFVTFFRDPTSSWRPYAAGLPWIRDAESKKILAGLLKRLDFANMGLLEEALSRSTCSPA
jgi:hypothetical protein